MTLRLSVIPMWESARKDPILCWPGRFEELERHLEQHNNLHFSQLPQNVLGLSAIAQWIGQIQNGGTPQYFVNCLFNTHGLGNYTKNVISEIIFVLKRIGNKQFADIYIETLKVFAAEIDFHLKPPDGTVFFNTVRNKLLDQRICSNTEVFYNDYYHYTEHLRNIKFFNDFEFDAFVQQIVDKSGLIIDENCNADHCGFEILNFAELPYNKEDIKSGEIHPKFVYDDVMAAKFSIGLKNIMSHITSII